VKKYITLSFVLLAFLAVVIYGVSRVGLGSALSYTVFFLILALIYAILSLGLNLQWGYTGLFNIGIAGFFAVGAYTSAILTTAPTTDHLGGFNLPFAVGLVAAALVSGLVAFLVGLPTLRLKEDFLAIATIGIAEIFRLIFTNEAWLTYGPRGISGIPKPMADRISFDYNYFYLMLMLAAVIFIALFLQRMVTSPWGRVLKAIREDETVAMALGKNVFRYKMESLIIGSMIMGVAGGLYAHFMAFINPEHFLPFHATFIIWMMLIAGGSGSNLGAVVGALLIWGVWSGTDLITNFIPFKYAARAGAIRVIAIALILELILLLRPQGLFGEEIVEGTHKRG
jgi:branched-chain amino acid transport system permease protein